jgi:hypothetical protein
MAEPATAPKTGPLNRVRGLVQGVQILWFYALCCAVGLFGLFFAWLSLESIAEGELFVGVVLLAASALPISLPIVVFRERRRDKKLVRFLTENVERLAEGATGPDGVTYTLDTVLVTYQVRVSAVVISLKFDSGLYLHGPKHRLPKLLYTLFTVLLGWWVLDLQDWLDNFAIIGKNLGDSNLVTVGQLLGLEETAEEGTEPPDGSGTAGLSDPTAP